MLAYIAFIILVYYKSLTINLVEAFFLLIKNIIIRNNIRNNLRMLFTFYIFTAW